MRKPSLKKLNVKIWLLLAAIVVIGIATRLFFTPMEGYGFDIGVNRGWAASAAHFGLIHSYRVQLYGNMLPNYPPLSLGIFDVVGKIIGAGDTTFNEESMLFHIAIKIPGILADAIICVLLFFCLKRAGKRDIICLLGSLVYALHPAVIYDTAVWGQSDAIVVIFIVAALLAVASERWILSGVMCALALLSKPHAMLFAPLFAYVFLLQPKAFVRAFSAFALTMFVALLPFALGGSGQQVLGVYTHSVGYYPTLTSGAYNLWWSLFADKANDIQDTTLFFGTLPYRTFALGLFAVLYATLLSSFRSAFWKKQKSEHLNVLMLLAIAALVNQAYFTFNVEMHERYLFPYMALGLPMLFFNKRTALMYVLTSLCFFINLVGILPFTFFDKALYTEFPLLDAFIGTAQVWLFFLTWFFLREYQKTHTPSPMGLLKRRLLALQERMTAWKILG